MGDATEGLRGRPSPPRSCCLSRKIKQNSANYIFTFSPQVFGLFWVFFFKRCSFFVVINYFEQTRKSPVSGSRFCVSWCGGGGGGGAWVWLIREWCESPGGGGNNWADYLWSCTCELLLIKACLTVFNTENSRQTWLPAFPVMEETQKQLPQHKRRPSGEADCVSNIHDGKKEVRLSKRVHEGARPCVLIPD